jgi:hypothetical protein
MILAGTAAAAMMFASPAGGCDKASIARDLNTVWRNDSSPHLSHARLSALHESIAVRLERCAESKTHYMDSRIGDLALAASNLEDAADLRQDDPRRRCAALRGVRRLYIRLGSMKPTSQADIATLNASKAAIMRLDRTCP